MFSKVRKGWFWVATLTLVCTMSTSQAQEHHESDDEHEAASSDAFHLATYRTWAFRSFLPDANDDANVLGQEFVFGWGMGNYDVTNISYIEFADYPVGVPGYPPGNPSPGTVADTGINDLLSAFLFAKKGHHGPHHFGFGFATQLPTGSGDTLSSGKYSLGPAIDYDKEVDESVRVLAKKPYKNLEEAHGDIKAVHREILKLTHGPHVNVAMVGTYTPTKNWYVYVAPPGNGDLVEGVYVDRFFVVKAQ